MYVLEYGDEDSQFVISFNDVYKKLVSSRKIAILGLVSPNTDKGLASIAGENGRLMMVRVPNIDAFSYVNPWYTFYYCRFLRTCAFGVPCKTM
jgi:hypothetical protein